MAETANRALEQEISEAVGPGNGASAAPVPKRKYRSLSPDTRQQMIKEQLSNLEARRYSEELGLEIAVAQQEALHALQDEGSDLLQPKPEELAGVDEQARQVRLRIASLDAAIDRLRLVRV